MSATAWELVFMMFVLKLPILYLIGVVWWAVRAEPQPYEPAVVSSRVLEPKPCPWTRPSRRPSGRGPARRRAARLSATR